MLVEADPHVSFTREDQHVGLLPLFEEHPKSPAVPIDTVGQHPRRLHSHLQCPLEHLLGQKGLGSHPDLLGHPGPLPTLLIFGPLLGQIQLPVDEGLSSSLGSVGYKHPHLAVLPLAEGTAILAFYPDALISLLDEARLIDEQNTLLACQVLEYVLPQVVSNCVGIPVGSSQEVLEAIGCGVPRHLGQLPRVLALSPRKQTMQIFSDILAPAGALQSGQSELRDVHIPPPVPRSTISPSSGPPSLASLPPSSKRA